MSHKLEAEVGGLPMSKTTLASRLPLPVRAHAEPRAGRCPRIAAREPPPWPRRAPSLALAARPAGPPRADCSGHTPRTLAGRAARRAGRAELRAPPPGQAARPASHARSSLLAAPPSRDLQRSASGRRPHS